MIICKSLVNAQTYHENDVNRSNTVKVGFGKKYIFDIYFLEEQLEINFELQYFQS